MSRGEKILHLGMGLPRVVNAVLPLTPFLLPISRGLWYDEYPHVLHKDLSSFQKFFLKHCLFDINLHVTSKNRDINAKRNDPAFLDAIKKATTSRNSHPRLRNAARFISLAKRIKDDKLLLAVVNGYANIAVNYDVDKAETGKKIFKSWEQTPYDTLMRGKGVCIDIALLKGALLTAIKGKEWHQQKTAIAGIAVSSYDHETARADNHSKNHAVFITKLPDGIYYLDNYKKNISSYGPSSDIDWKEQWLACSEIGELGSDGFCLSQKCAETFMEFTHHCYADGTYRNFEKIRPLFLASPLYEAGFFVEVPSDKEKLYHSKEKPSMRDAMIELFDRHSQTPEDRKLLGKIQKVSIEANPFYVKPNRPEKTSNETTFGMSLTS